MGRRGPDDILHAFLLKRRSVGGGVKGKGEGGVEGEEGEGVERFR